MKTLIDSKQKNILLNLFIILCTLIFNINCDSTFKPNSNKQSKIEKDKKGKIENDNEVTNISKPTKSVDNIKPSGVSDKRYQNDLNYETKKINQPNISKTTRVDKDLITHENRISGDTNSKNNKIKDDKIEEKIDKIANRVLNLLDEKTLKSKNVNSSKKINQPIERNEADISNKSNIKTRDSIQNNNTKNIKSIVTDNSEDSDISKDIDISINQDELENEKEIKNQEEEEIKPEIEEKPWMEQLGTLTTKCDNLKTRNPSKFFKIRFSIENTDNYKVYYKINGNPSNSLDALKACSYIPKKTSAFKKVSNKEGSKLNTFFPNNSFNNVDNNILYFRIDNTKLPDNATLLTLFLSFKENKQSEETKQFIEIDIN